MSSGPLMFDIEGLTLTSNEKSLLAEPATGGVILFSRNFHSAPQLLEMTTQIKAIRPDILLAVDQEGGRVQRFQSQEFTRLPAMSQIGALYQKMPDTTLQLAYECGWVTGFELASYNIDINLAPVLDISHGINNMLDSRCFSRHRDIVILLGREYIKGIQSAGISAVGKHFPGHGGVAGDTHLSLPKDTRSHDELQSDLEPFAEAVKQGINGIMPSHVIYSEVSAEPAGFSAHWLKTILREQLKFKGAVFSDCLSMNAASAAGTFTERADKALKAGCDMILVCNNRQGLLKILESFNKTGENNRSPYLAQIKSKPADFSSAVERQNILRENLHKLLSQREPC